MFFDIKKYAIHDGPGIRTTVFFKGCPLRCLWCHNPESIRKEPEIIFRQNRCIGCGNCVEVCPQGAISLENGIAVTNIHKCRLCFRCTNVCIPGARELIGVEYTVPEVIAEIEKDIMFYDTSGGGVTFSGGEPLMQPDILCSLLEECKRRRINTAVDTTCHAEPEIIERVASLADLFLCDIKHMEDKAHLRLTGVGNKLILENIRLLADLGNNIIIRLPFIPGWNDTDKNIEMIGEFVSSLPLVKSVDILPYNTGGSEKKKRLNKSVDIMSGKYADKDMIEAAVKKLESYGLEVKVEG